MIVNKDGMSRDIPTVKLNEYLAAGWTQGDEPVRVVAKPKKAEVHYESQPAVAMPDAVNEEQAQTSEGE